MHISDDVLRRLVDTICTQLAVISTYYDRRPNVWGKIKTVFAYIGAIAVAIGAYLLGRRGVRDNSRGADAVRDDIDETERDNRRATQHAEDAGSDNRRAQRLADDAKRDNRDAQDIIKRVRARGPKPDD